MYHPIGALLGATRHLAVNCASSRRVCPVARNGLRSGLSIDAVRTIWIKSFGLAPAQATASGAVRYQRPAALGHFRWAPAAPAMLLAHKHYSSSSWSCAHRRRLLFGSHVREALANGQPIVALESTVITHGLPEPANLELALSVEQEIRRTTAAAECTPATVGIIRGQIVVGLSEDEIRFLANRELSQPIKASRRDIPIALANGLSAGTTVAATMAIAVSCREPALGLQAGTGRWAGPIKVFATGGTGGVHRGGERSMDISADLYELARSPMGVVCSGFKSFLDTRRSLEFLETLGCTVLSLAHKTHPRPDGHQNEATARTYGSSSASFPAFYTRHSQVRSPFIAHTIQEAGEILFQCLEAPLAERRSMLLANPIEFEFELMAGADSAASSSELDSLLADISAQIDGRTDLEGKEKTPLILEQINRRTGGRSLKANVELLKNNARVGAQLAMEYAHLAASGQGCPLTTGE